MSSHHILLTIVSRPSRLLPSVTSRLHVMPMLALALLSSTSACMGSRESATPDSTVAAPSVGTAGHTHDAPPHGGMLVELGDGSYHLEFVLDTASTILTAYVLDGAAKEPVRLSQSRIDLKMLDLVEGNVEVFTVLAAKGSVRTGETVDNTATYMAFVPELKGRGHFRAVIQRVEVGENVFTDIPVTFPAEARL